MPHGVIDDESALELAARVDDKYKPVWEGRSRKERAALAKYFLPHNSRKAMLTPTRPRIVKWYCPFAAQCDFASGHRYCINVYTGCAHGCVYCYAAAYEPDEANQKRDFERLIARDMEDLERFDVPPAPVHMSNSTDAFQPLEKCAGHTRIALEQVLEHRGRFTTVTVLTKNPLRPVQLGCVDHFKALSILPSGHTRHKEFGRNHHPGFVIEVSLAFWREEARLLYDPCTPTIEERVEGMRALRAARIPLVLRIDPLFPRLPTSAGVSRSYADFDLPEPQTIDDLENLVSLAKELKVRHVVYSCAKITQPRWRKLSATMQALREVYRACAAPQKLDFHGGSWRLPQRIAEAQVVRPFLALCDKYGITAKYCKQNLVETP
jgi:DNA repair photolyase